MSISGQLRQSARHFMKKRRRKRHRSRLIERGKKINGFNLDLKRNSEYVLITKWNDKLGKSKNMSSWDASLNYDRLVYQKKYVLILRVGSPYYHSFLANNSLINIRH